MFYSLLKLRSEPIGRKFSYPQPIGGHSKPTLSYLSSGKPIFYDYERARTETFVHSFLSEVFPTPFRFGTGDVTNTGAKSGELDVIVEYPFSPSLPIGHLEELIWSGDLAAWTAGAPFWMVRGCRFR
jgi:hypothetical protein